jgi:hypothetical protein
MTYVDDVKVSAANARVGDFDQNLVAPGDDRPGDLSKRQLLGAIIELQGGVRRTHNYSFLVSKPGER